MLLVHSWIESLVGLRIAVPHRLAMFFGLTLGVVGCALPFAVTPIRRAMGKPTYLWSDKGYSCQENGFVLNKPKRN